MSSPREDRVKSKSGVKCAVFGCMDYYSARHRFPVRYPEICDEWIKVLSANARVTTLPRDVVVRKLVVCHRHFSEDSKCPGTRRGLKANAVPSLFIPDLEECREDNTEVENTEGNVPEESCILENVRQELCRVCGNKEPSLIPIFDDTSINNANNMPLVKMLEMYLPLQIIAEDMFPLSICEKCFNTLHLWHDLYVTCVAADKAFHSIFYKDKNWVADEQSKLRKSVGDVPVAVTASDELKGSDHTYVKPLAEIENVNGKKQCVLCEQCGIDLGFDDCNEMSSEILNLMYTRKIRVYICKYCVEFFKNKQELRDHYKLCEVASTICEKCGKVFQQRKHFEKHKARVHDYVNVMCEKCGKSMRHHLLSHHMDSVHSQPYYCDLCCKILRSKFLYSGHMQQHSKGNIKSTFKIEPVSQDGSNVFICPACNQSFQDKPSIITHLTELREVKCPICRVKLKNEKQLVLHSCQKWICQYCGKSFYNKLLWKEHERIHTGEKPYKCRSCNFYFRTLQQRTLHHRTHLNRSCECKFCLKKFKHMSALRKHMACHEGVEYTCPVCSKTFPRRFSLELHVRRHLKKSMH